MVLPIHGLKRLIRPLVPVGIVEHLTRRRYEHERTRLHTQPAADSNFGALGGNLFAEYRHATALVLYWSHAFGVAEGPARAVGNALASLQFQVTMLNIGSQEALDACAASGTRFDLAISVGSPPLAKEAGGRPVFEAFGDVFYMWGLDSVINDLARVWAVQAYFDTARRSTRLRFLFPDRGNTALVQEVLTPVQAMYFPFGGFYDALPSPTAMPPREVRMAVLGTIGFELAEVAKSSVAELIDTDKTTSLSAAQRDALVDALHATGGPTHIAQIAGTVLRLPAERLLSWEFLPLLTKLDAYEKRRRRLLVVEALRGQPVDFFGMGWEHFVGDCKSFRVMGQIPDGAVSSLCRHYAGMVNFDPNWDDGVHDRVYTALGNGCRILTNANRALAEIAHPDGCLFTYDTNRPDLSASVEAILAAPPMSDHDVTRFRHDNSWSARMDAFVRAL